MKKALGLALMLAALMIAADDIVQPSPCTPDMDPCSWWGWLHGCKCQDDTGGGGSGAGFQE